MDPTWEETSAAPSRSPASADAAPSWEDTKEVTASAEPSWDETTDLQSQYGTPGQQAIAGLEGAARGIAGPIATGAERLAGVSPEAMRLREEANPWTAGLSEAGAFAGAAALTAGTSAELATLPGLVGKVGEAAKVATGGGKILGNAAKLGAELAAMQGGSEISRALENDPDQTVGSALTHMGLSTLVGAGIGVPLGAVSAGWEMLNGPTVNKILGKIKADWGMGQPLNQEGEIVSPMLKQVLNIFGGVPKETMENYAAQRDLVMAAPEFSEVYGKALDHLLDMQENLETKKLTAEKARSEFKDFLSQQKLQLKQMGHDAASAESIAKQALKEAQTRIGIGVQNEALESAPKIFSAVEKLRTQALELSQSARDILDNTPGELSLKPIFQAIRPMQDKLYSEGFAPMAEELGKTMDVFAHQYGDKISYPDAKSMIQGLQKRGKWDMAANEISSGLRPYYNQLSGIMNEALKDAVKPYRAAMEPTAKAFELLGKLDRYGSPESANKAVLALKNTANYVNEMPLLKDLEQKTNIPFTHALDPYAKPELRDAMVKALPEYAQAQKLAQSLERLKDPQVQAALAKAPYLSQAYQALQKAETAVEQQIARNAKMAGLTPATLESKMKSVMAGRGMHARRLLENIPGIAEIPELSDLTIPEVLDLINIRQAFEKGNMNGSRNVNMMAGMGSSVGTILGSFGGHLLGAPILGGGIGGTIGAGAGAMWGGILDKEGPAMVKEHLDKYLNRYGDLPKLLGTKADTVRAALAHFLGDNIVPSAKAFKSMANYLDSVKNGTNTMAKAAKSLFEGGKTVPNHIWADKDKTDKLDKKLQKYKVDEQGMLDIGGDLGHYLPAHGMALSKTVANAVNYINQNRPIPQKLAPLDPVIEPSKESVYAFNRGLQIAEQPLTIFQHIKDNTLLPEDVQHLNAMYPGFYPHMKTAVMDAMTDHLAKEGTVPYSLRQSLSLFLGETMDSSLAPQNIMAAQATFMAQKANAAMATQQPTKKGTSKLGKMSEQYVTADQSATARRSQQAKS